MRRLLLFVGVLALSLVVLVSWSSTIEGGSIVPYPKGKTKIKDTLTVISKSEKAWRLELDEKSYEILRNKGTEPAKSGKYDKNYDNGTYCCKACNLPLFDSDDKFDSGTGWPSYSNYIHNHVEHVFDGKYGWNRTEVVCKRCKGHLGHVFDDGPKPTGLRYCINSLSLEFIEE